MCDIAISGPSSAPQQIARTLGVRNILQGSAQTTRENLRAAVVIVGGVTGTTIWADDSTAAEQDPCELWADLSRTIACDVAWNARYNTEIGRSTANDAA